MRPLAAAIVLLGLLTVACGGGKAPGASPTPSDVGSPTSTAAPAAQTPGGAVPLQFKPLAAPPPDTAVIVETGCMQCDGPTESLIRVYQRPGGTYATETMITPDKLGLLPHTIQTAKGWEEVAPMIAGFSVAPDASDMIVGICTAGYCGSLNLSDAEETMLFRSRDGGITWQPYGRLGPGDFMTGEIKNGNVLVARYAGQVPNGGTPVPPEAPDYHFFPSGEAVPAPTGADAYGSPVVLPNGRMAWKADDARLVADDGSTIVAVDGAHTAYQPNSSWPPSGISLVWDYRDNIHNSYLGLFDATGRSTSVYSSPAFFRLGPWLDSAHVYGNSNVQATDLTVPVPTFFVGYLPALIDLDQRLIQPIERPFLEPDFPRGRNHIVAVQRGTLLRVNTGGQCLSLRTEPHAASQPVECVADGVLLRLGIGDGQHPGGVYDAGGRTWLSALAPDGAEGYVDAAFVER